MEGTNIQLAKYFGIHCSLPRLSRDNNGVIEWERNIITLWSGILQSDSIIHSMHGVNGKKWHKQWRDGFIRAIWGLMQHSDCYRTRCLNLICTKSVTYTLMKLKLTSVIWVCVKEHLIAWWDFINSEYPITFNLKPNEYLSAPPSFPTHLPSSSSHPQLLPWSIKKTHPIYLRPSCKKRVCVKP